MHVSSLWKAFARQFPDAVNRATNGFFLVRGRFYVFIDDRWPLRALYYGPEGTLTKADGRMETSPQYAIAGLRSPVRRVERTRSKHGHPTGVVSLYRFRSFCRRRKHVLVARSETQWDVGSSHVRVVCHLQNVGGSFALGMGVARAWMLPPK